MKSLILFPLLAAGEEAKTADKEFWKKLSPWKFESRKLTKGGEAKRYIHAIKKKGEENIIKIA